MRWMAAGLLALCAWAADAQELGVSPAMTLERSALQADVRVLQDAYEVLHPGLYRYNTPAQMRTHFDALRRDLDGTRTLTQAYLALSEFTAKVRCGHTWANFSNQSEDVQHGLFESGRHRLPVQFVWRDGRIVVTPGRDAGALQDEHSLGAEAFGVPLAAERFGAVFRRWCEQGLTRQPPCAFKAELRYDARASAGDYEPARRAIAGYFTLSAPPRRF